MGWSVDKGVIRVVVDVETVFRSVVPGHNIQPPVTVHISDGYGGGIVGVQADIRGRQEIPGPVAQVKFVRLPVIGDDQIETAVFIDVRERHSIGSV